MMLGSVAAVASLCVVLPAADVDYARDVEPILKTRCQSCHGPTKQRSGLRLDDGANIRKGGDSGPAVVAGASAKSLLLDHVAGRNGATRMPPTGAPLAAREIELLRQWIDQGAKTPEPPAKQASKLPPADGWVWKPLVGPTPPSLSTKDAAWTRTPVDAFIVARLRSEGLGPSPVADRRVLLRRVTFDLTGLPPSSEDCAAFLADKSDDAYEKLVERLLASPSYGERWARHWLDVVHYADSHGQEHDKPRPHSWPYRDYIVRSFNADKPYGRFVREQVAGDALFPGNAEAMRATGFLAAGPWDESALVTIKEDTLDRRAAEYLDRDDIVCSTLSTFAGITVGCARCHDHKFDPIPQTDYYALQAVFAGVQKTERSFDVDPAVAKRRAELQTEHARLTALAGKSDPQFRSSAAAKAVEEFVAERQTRERSWETPAPIRYSATDGTILKALADRSILAVGPRPENETYRIEIATDRPQTAALRLEVLADETLPHHGPGRQDNGNLHVTELKVSAKPRGADGPLTPVKLANVVADVNEAPMYGIEKAIDGNPATFWGIYPAVGKSHRAAFRFAAPVGYPGGTTFVVEIQQRSGNFHNIGRLRIALSDAEPTPAAVEVPPESLQEWLITPPADRTPELKQEVARFALLSVVERSLAALPAEEIVYTAKPSAVKAVHVLSRGDAAKPGVTATPGSVTALATLPARFESASSEGARRAALAEWLASRENALTWRTMANRVWQWHFGRGIVDTPNDLGKMGGAPSHPELLDWLASELRDTQSLKRLHRTIVLSATYRQQVRHDAVAAGKDADNRMFWRMNRRKLEAEAVHDAALAVAGRLLQTCYGAPVKQFTQRPGVADTPIADYDDLDLDSPAARRRSIYRFVFRTRPDPFLAALDCPDFSLSAPIRTPSVSAPQALAVWNNAFMLRQSEWLARWAERQAPTAEGRIQALSMKLFGRDARRAEVAAWHVYAHKHGWANFCRVLLASSEFHFVD